VVSPGSIDEGYAEGLKRAEQTVNAECERLRTAIEAVGALQERLFRECEAQIVDLALAIAAELVRKTREGDRDLAVRLAASALDALGKAGRTSLRVSPIDRDRVEEWVAAFPVDPSRPEVVVVVDTALAAGDIVAEAETGAVDARMEARLAQVARALREGSAAS
jgi:flagellar assembly protein FliH